MDTAPPLPGGFIAEEREAAVVLSPDPRLRKKQTGGTIVNGASATANGHNHANGVSNPEEGKSRRRTNENGFEEWGGYMAAKKAKLDMQFNTSKTSFGDGEAGAAAGGASFGMFDGLSIYINGYTDPPEPTLREMFIVHGGRFHSYCSSDTSFVIATNLSVPSKNLYASKTLKPEWITESIRMGVKLDPRKYMLYNLNEENKQMTLTQLMQPKLKDIPSNGIDERSVSPLHDAITSDHGSEPRGVSINGNHSDANEDPLMVSVDLPSPPDTLSPEERSVVKSTTVSAGRKIKFATEEGFLEEFFKNSRLHLISDQKKEMQNRIGRWQKDSANHRFENLELFKELASRNRNSEIDLAEETGCVLMHIDLDCFFVSVGLLSRPHLRGKPAVVTHSTGKDDGSKADIASASYEARKYGISNGMWVSEAKLKCPSLEVIPYDFDEYRRVSDLFLSTVASFTLDIEPSSVDEMVVDVTSILKSTGCTPVELAEFFRRQIFEATKCPASVGIGANRLLAKLATKKAKPDGSYYLKDPEARSFIEELEVGDLPGIGYSHSKKLLELFAVHKCKDLLKVPLKDLATKFGDKTAEKMIQFCQGKDTAELKYGFDCPKSISIDVNYGIRFTKDQEVSDFLLKMCQELGVRALKSQACGSHLTVKILVRKKGAGEPLKHGGHGSVDCITKSNRFLQPTRDYQEMYRSALKIIKAITHAPKDFRGMGLALTDLKFDFDKPSGSKNIKQKTLFEVAMSRGKKMVESVKKVSNLVKSTTRQDSATANGHGSSTSGLNNKINGHNVEESSMPLENGKTTNYNNVKVDISVLRELPKEIAREMAHHYGIQDADFDEMDWLEDEEVRRDVVGTNGEEISPAAAQSANDAIESVIQQSIDGHSSSVNPYDNVDSIDPGFLSALPEAIRNEVLLQFQQAKGANFVRTERTDNEPQPCSSKQAIERDLRERNLSSNHNQIEADYQQDSSHLQSVAEDFGLLCEEKMCQEAELITTIASDKMSPDFVRRKQYGTKKSAELNKVPGRAFRSPSLSKTSSRKLNFEDDGDDDDHYDEQIGRGHEDPLAPRNWEQLWSSSYKNSTAQESLLQPETIVMPALNGVVDIEEVRNLIRAGMKSVGDPSEEDVHSLETYFDELITRGWLKQTQILLKFICRKSSGLPDDCPWKDIVQNITTNTQRTCKRLFTSVLNLE